MSLYNMFVIGGVLVVCVFPILKVLFLSLYLWDTLANADKILRRK